MHVTAVVYQNRLFHSPIVLVVRIALDLHVSYRWGMLPLSYGMGLRQQHHRPHLQTVGLEPRVLLFTASL
jgi:hypothetical protein